MAIIYSYPEIPEVEGGDLLLISDTGAPNKPTRSVDIDDLAAYIGTVVGVVQNLQSVLTVGNTYVSADGYGTFTLNDIANNDGSITFVNPNEGWGYQISAEEGINITDGSGTNLMSIQSSGLSIRDGAQIMNIGTNALTATRNVYFPDASGTIALTSDIPSPGPSGSGTTNYTARWTNASTLGIGTLYDNGTNVGIGTTNPTQKLEVNGTVLLSTLPNNNGRLCLGSVSTNLFSNAASGHLYISTNGSTRMTVLNNGNVGIGTTSPTDKLSIAGSLSTFHSGNTTEALRVTMNSNDVFLSLYSRTNQSSQQVLLRTNGNSYLNGGNVGIGTTAPSEMLTVGDGSNNSTINIDKGVSSNGTLLFNKGGASSAYIRHTIYEDLDIASGAGTLKFLTGTGNSTRMVIQALGNVGIGTTSPSAKLDVEGRVDFSNDLRLRGTDSSANQGVARFYVDSSNKLFIDTANNGSNMFVIDSSGNVGIGTTSPDSLLEISTTDGTKNFIKLTSGAGGVNPALVFEKSAVEQGVIQYIRNGDLKIYNTDSDGGVMLSGSSATNYDMYINNSGNVGIGTTSPDYALHVDPTVKIGDRQGTDGSLILQSQQGPNITFTSSGDNLHISGSTGSSNGNTIRLLDEIKIFEFHANIGGTIRINRGNRGLMDTNIGGYVVQQQDTTASNGKSTFLSTDNNGTILRSTSYGSIGTSGDIQFQFGGGDNSSEPAPSTKMIIKNNGNVGIGNSSPTKELEIGTNAAAETEFRMHSDGSGRYFNIQSAGNFTSVKTTGSQNFILDSSGSAGYITMVTNASERMRVNYNGNVGIGTTNPSTKLHVQGAASGYLFRVQGTSILNVYDPGAAAEIGVGSGSGDKLKLFSNDSLNNGITIDTSGNVGIGTTSPAEKLHVFGGAAAIEIDSTTNEASLKYDNSTTTAAIKLANNDLKTELGGTEVMRILANGNVGIGTTNPGNKLDVVGNISTSTNFIGDNVIVNKITAATSGGDIKFRNNDGANKVVITNSGNVGIGTTSPNAKLNVNGDIKIEGENELYFGGSGSVPGWEIKASGSDLVINDTGSNVGSVLFNNDEGIVLPRLTTTEINAISLPNTGLTVYNTTLNTLCFYNGSSWQKVSHANM